MLDRHDLKSILWIATALILIVAVAVPFLVLHGGNNRPPSLGDWGDFIGGMGTLLAIVWAIGGYLFNHMQIHGTQKDIEGQLELFQSAIGSLNRIAATMQGRFAESVAEAMPILVATGSMGQVPGPGNRFMPIRTNNWYIDLRNDGVPFTLLSIKSMQSDWTIVNPNTGIVRSGQSFRLRLDTNKDHKDRGTIFLIFHFQNSLGMCGWFDLKASKVVEGVVIGPPQMGPPPVPQVPDVDD